METSPVQSFGGVAKSLARNPLGIVALFIVLVYALATSFAAFAELQPLERFILVWFIVLFPVLVLGSFLWLVAKHPHSLYSPADFQREEHFVELQTFQRKTLEERVDAQVEAVKTASSAIKGVVTDKKLLAAQYLARWNSPELSDFRKLVEGSSIRAIEKDREKSYALAQVLNFFEEMSIALKGDLLDEELINSAFANVVRRRWADTESWILEIRQRTNDPQALENFEALARRWSSN